MLLRVRSMTPLPCAPRWFSGRQVRVANGKTAAYHHVVCRLECPPGLVNHSQNDRGLGERRPGMFVTFPSTCIYAAR